MARQVLAYDVGGVVGALDLEILVIGGNPTVYDLDHLDRALIEDEAARRFITAMARIAFDPDFHG